MLATKSAHSHGVPGWRVGAINAVVGPSDTPGTLLFLSSTVAGVGAAVLLSCVRGVTSESGNLCMTSLSRNGFFFVAGEAPGVQKSLPQITQTVAWGDPGSPAPFVVVAIPAPSLPGMDASGALGSPST